jgi:hypothetical protein
MIACCPVGPIYGAKHVTLRLILFTHEHLSCLYVPLRRVFYPYSKSSVKVLRHQQKHTTSVSVLDIEHFGYYHADKKGNKLQGDVSNKQ